MEIKNQAQQFLQHWMSRTNEGSQSCVLKLLLTAFDSFLGPSRSQVLRGQGFQAQASYRHWSPNS